MNKSPKLLSASAEKVGVASASILGVFCPACFPAIGVLLSSVGLGFLVSAKIISGITLAFIFLAFAGFAYSYSKEHKNPLPILLAMAGAFGIYGGRYLFPSMPIIYTGAVLFISASILNWYLKKKALQLKSCCIVNHSANR